MRQTDYFFTICFLFLSIAFAGSVTARQKVLPESEGLWEYTGLITSRGESLPLTGVFLIKNGFFLQQSIFNGEPFAEQNSMAHAGTCWAGGAGLRLTANQTLSISPVNDEQLSSAGSTEHDLQVSRDGEDLTLVFGGGTSTVQTFKRIGDAVDARFYEFSTGALAFANGYFVLVNGDAQASVTGYGKYIQAGDSLSLSIIRWAESDGDSTRNLRDVTLDAFFDGSILTLPDGRGFAVVAKY